MPTGRVGEETAGSPRANGKEDFRDTFKNISPQAITLTNALAPITSLPTEILVAIFVKTRNFQTLGRVIRRWREIVNGILVNRTIFLL